MKKILIGIGIGLFSFICCAVIVLYVWIGGDMQKNIKKAQEKYAGTSEEALISFLEDENNTPWERTHLAIWTLGQLQSKKALPVLYKYDKNDPEGKTCYGKHNTLLCQYEISKAINKINGNWIIPLIIPGKPVNK